MITGDGTAFPNDSKAVGARPTYRLRISDLPPVFIPTGIENFLLAC